MFANMSIPIIFEDDDIVVINKPPGVVVNRATSNAAPSIQDWMEEKQRDQAFVSDWATLVPTDFSTEYGTPENIFQDRLGMVHRLDKETSGVLVLAKHPGALVHLLAEFRNRRTTKVYQCLVHGKLRTPAGTIDAPLARDPHQRQRFAVVASGRSAQTRYVVQQTFSGFNQPALAEWFDRQSSLSMSLREFSKQTAIYQGFSVLTCEPKTGRTHQIRVHLKHWQHPLVGDVTYLGKKRAKLDSLWCPRQFLHAAELTLIHPRTHQLQTFQAPLSDDLEQVLGLLESTE